MEAYEVVQSAFKIKKKAMPLLFPESVIYRI